MIEQTETSERNKIATISDLKQAMESGGAITRHQIAMPAGGIQPKPLMPDTEQFAPEWLCNWHRQQHDWPSRDVATYSIADAVVCGDGHLWLDDQLITSQEVMPSYVANLLEIAKGGTTKLHSYRELPVRTIDEPCLVAVGHGTRVYGHFLIEMLFRLLVARRVFQVTGLRYRVLLHHTSPAWLLYILDKYFHIGVSDIEFIRAEEEQVMLRQAIVPTLLSRDGRFLPIANELISELLEILDVTDAESSPSRIFISRAGFHNSASYRRSCLNEHDLIDVAVKRHGFAPVCIEQMVWKDQLALFRNSKIIVGLAGSGLHNALFAKPESCLGSIGLMNLVQSQIGALRMQRNAFFTKDFDPIHDFTIDIRLYEDFLDRVCNMP